MDRQKAIKGLEICTKDIPMSNAVHKSDFCKECPYYNAEYSYCWNQIVMMRDALALLKEQEAVVRCKDCKFRGNINICPLAYIEKTEQFTALCVDEWFCGSGKRKEVK